MGLFDTLRSQPAASDSDGDDTEQLAADDPAPRGNAENEGGWLYRLMRGATAPPQFSTPSRRSTVETAIEFPPEDVESDFNDYYYGFSFVQAALDIFAHEVMAPGINVTATRDGERDEDMEEALETWNSQCVVEAGEFGAPLASLCRSIAIRRRGKGTQFVEPVGTEAEPDALAGLMSHEPSNFEIHKRNHKNIVIQPDDDVESGHPRTPDGDAGAYVQFSDLDAEVVFAADDLYKFVYNPDESRAFGRTIFEAIAPAIDRLIQKMEDRDLSIRMTHYPHVLHSLGEGTDTEQAKKVVEAIGEGSLNVQSDDRRSEKDTLAGSISVLPGKTDTTITQGDVPDLTAAVKDDIEQIFSILPVSKLKIAYEESINQFVAEPQMEKDDRLVEHEQRYLERNFVQPVHERKADELFLDGEYPGEVTAKIEAEPESNPLGRESFPTENLQALGSFIDSVLKNGGTSVMPFEAWLSFAGVDMDDLEDEFGEMGEDFDPAQFAPEMQGGEGDGTGDDDSGDDNPDNTDDED